MDEENITGKIFIGLLMLYFCINGTIYLISGMCRSDILDILSSKYSVVRTYIEQVFDKLKNWEQVENFVGLSGDQLSLPILRSFFGYSEEDLNEKVWAALINYYKEKDKAIEITKLGNNTRNNASIPTDTYSSWQLYKQKMLR